MSNGSVSSRRDFLKSMMAVGALGYIGGRDHLLRGAFGASNLSRVFRVNACPVHDGQLRHVGVDTLLSLLSDQGIKFYKSSTSSDPWAGSTGIIAPGDVVLIKVNCQWKCRGTTNTRRLARTDSPYPAASGFVLWRGSDFREWPGARRIRRCECGWDEL